MAKIIPHIININKRISKFSPQINAATEEAEVYAIQKLKTKRHIDVIFSDAFKGDIIPETHVGGHTYTDDFITITLDSNSKSIRTDDIFLTICHELCHATRWQYNNEWSSTLFDGMIFEGLATAFEIEAAHDNDMRPSLFARTIHDRSNKENEKILAILSKQFDSQYYDYGEIFFTGNETTGLPRWSGYSLGYYFV